MNEKELFMAKITISLFHCFMKQKNVHFLRGKRIYIYFISLGSCAIANTCFDLMKFYCYSPQKPDGGFNATIFCQKKRNIETGR